MAKRFAGIYTVLALIGIAACVASSTAIYAMAAWQRQSMPSDETANVFLHNLVSQVVANRYGEAWRTLAPQYRKLVESSAYARCEMREPMAGVLASYQLLSAADGSYAAPGLGTVPAKMLRVRIVIKDMATGERVPITNTFHLVVISGSLYWTLTSERYAMYKAGRCTLGGAAVYGEAPAPQGPAA